MTVADIKISPAPMHMQPSDKVYISRSAEYGRCEYLHTDKLWYSSTLGEYSTGYFSNRKTAEAVLQEVFPSPDSSPTNIDTKMIAILE